MTLWAGAALLALGMLLGWLFRSVSAARALSRLEAELALERRAASEKLTLLDGAKEQLRDAFRALSSDALESTQRSFLQVASAALDTRQREAAATLEARERAIDALLRPVQDALGQLGTTLQQLESKREGAYRALEQQVRGMAETQRQLQHETFGLVQALRPSHGRGRWGEIHLQRLVELADMVEHCDFELQASLPLDGGGRVRPDLLVRLPGGKTIAVDAKVPLKAWLEAHDMAEGAAREGLLAEHVRQVRERVRELGSKSYWSALPGSPDFVVLYVPNESALAEAIGRAPDLLEEAWAQRVIPASPTILMTLLKTAHHVWQQERIADNARRISEVGQRLYERVADLKAHFVRLRRHLDCAVEAFNGAVGTLERRLDPAARQLRELGVGSAKDLPPVEPIERIAREPMAPELQDDAG